MVSSPRPEQAPRPSEPTAPRQPTPDPSPSRPYAEAAERAENARVVGTSLPPAVRTDIFVQSPPSTEPRPEPIDIITEPDVKVGDLLDARPTQVETAPSEPRTTDGEARSPIAELPATAEPTREIDPSRFSKYVVINREPSPTKGVAATIDTERTQRSPAERRAAFASLFNAGSETRANEPVTHDSTLPAAANTSEVATAPLQEAPRFDGPSTDLEPRVESPQEEIPHSLPEEIKAVIASSSQQIRLNIETPNGPVQIGTAALASLSNPDGRFHAQVVVEKIDDYVDPAHLQNAKIGPEHIQAGRNTTHVIWVDQDTNEVGLTAWVGNNDSPSKQLSVVYHLDEITPETADTPIAERLNSAVGEGMTPAGEAALASRLAQSTPSYVDAEGGAATLSTLPRSLPEFLTPPAKVAPTETPATAEGPLTTEWVVNGVANPVTVTEFLGTDAAGRAYVGVEGHLTGIPLDQIQASNPKAFDEMIQRWVETTTTRSAPTQTAPEHPIYPTPVQRTTEDDRTLTQSPHISQNTGGSTSGEMKSKRSSGTTQQKRSTTTTTKPRPAALDLYMKPSGRDIALSVIKTSAFGFLATLGQFFAKPKLISYETGKNGTTFRAKIRTSRGKVKEVTVHLKPGETINYKTLQRAINGQRFRNAFVR